MGLACRISRVLSRICGRSIASRQVPLRFVGDYFRGDGMGFNLSLHLNRDGTFQCESQGCLRDCGKTSGRWWCGIGYLHIDVMRAEGDFEFRSLGDLEIHRVAGKTILVDINDKELFRKHGASSCSCFSRPGDVRSIYDIKND